MFPWKKENRIKISFNKKRKEESGECGFFLACTDEMNQNET